MSLLLQQNSNHKPEIFETIQGEGLDAGVPAFFIRLQGCNVHCFFCDEKETWVLRENNSIEVNTSEILETLASLNPKLKRVVITGGEPTEQDLESLIYGLLESSYVISVETAATGQYLNKLFFEHPNFNITFSPKEIYSKNSKISDERIWKKCRELKFVIANKEAENYLLTTIIPKLDFAQNSCPIFLVPDWYNIEPMRAIALNLCLQNPERFRLGYQLQKIVEMP